MKEKKRALTLKILSRPKLSHFMHSNANSPSSDRHEGEHSATNSCASAMSAGSFSPPHDMSPWHPASPFMKSPWTQKSPRPRVVPVAEDGSSANELIGSLVREEGHVYSLASTGDLLYTGSDSKNIRVWKNLTEYSGFKSTSGLVKAIVIFGEKIFTGHQDGKIRVWKASSKDPRVHKRAGTLPTVKDYIKCSMKPSNYVEERRRRNWPWIRHCDAVSCLSLNEEKGLLYSCSWDKTMKVWRVADFKCLESINAHDDAVNAVAAGFDGLVFTGSADGEVKVWRREMQGRSVRHFHMQTLLQQESAVTAVAVSHGAAGTPAPEVVVYCGSSEGLVKFWEKKKWVSHGGVLRGHKRAVLCLALAGPLVFSGGADKTICVWRRESSGVHTCLSVLSGHGGPVKCLAVEEDRESPEKERRWILYSGSLDKSVKVWKVAETVAATLHAPLPASPLRPPVDQATRRRHLK